MSMKYFWPILFFSWIVWSVLAPYDSTDSVEYGRSGMTVRFDARNGCQYLESTFGGLTPRMDGNGTQVGCKP